SFVIEQLQMARRARHEQINDVLRARLEMRRFGRKWVREVRAQARRFAQQFAHSDRAEAGAALLEKPAASNRLAMFGGEVFEMRHNYSLVIVSSRFRATR